MRRPRLRRLWELDVSEDLYIQPDDFVTSPSLLWPGKSFRLFTTTLPTFFFLLPNQFCSSRIFSSTFCFNASLISFESQSIWAKIVCVYETACLSRDDVMIEDGGWSWLPRHRKKKFLSCLFHFGLWVGGAGGSVWKDWLFDLDYYFYVDRGGAAWQPMGVTGVNDGVGVNDLSITDLSEGARTPSR